MPHVQAMTTSNPIEARCGRTDSHGGHWAHAIGRPCAGNVNIVTAVVSPIPECGCGHDRHDGTMCTGTGATLDTIYGVPTDEACACTGKAPYVLDAY